MPRFGADGMLKAAEIAAVADYVMSLSGRAKATPEGAKIWPRSASPAIRPTARATRSSARPTSPTASALRR